MRNFYLGNRKVIGVLLLACWFAFATGSFGQDRQPQPLNCVSFDAPVATFTSPSGINNQGEIAGTFDTQTTPYGAGFIRDSHGTFTIVNIAEAQWTSVSAINDEGDVAGSFFDGVVVHGFIRKRDASITVVDGPNAMYTALIALNNRGESLGAYQSPSTGSSNQGFLRDALGNLMPINAPNAAQTGISVLNNQGEIAGTFSDIYGFHEYVRTRQGNFKSFDIPDSELISVNGINDRTQILGTFQPLSLNFKQFRGYVYEPARGLTVFNFPNAYETDPQGIDEAGDVAGDYFETSSGNPSHGFVRDEHGSFSSFDPSGSRFTAVRAINDSGTVTGQFVDASTGTWRGFACMQQR